jgi:hypothetical protein
MLCLHCVSYLLSWIIVSQLCLRCVSHPLMVHSVMLASFQSFFNFFSSAFSNVCHILSWSIVSCRLPSKVFLISFLLLFLIVSFLEVAGHYFRIFKMPFLFIFPKKDSRKTHQILPHDPRMVRGVNCNPKEHESRTHDLPDFGEKMPFLFVLQSSQFSKLENHLQFLILSGFLSLGFVIAQFVF